MNYIKDINLTENKRYNMIIEVRKGSKDKNELVDNTFDKLQCVRKCRIKYPFYYGCFPQTLAGDNDPADAILICDHKHDLLDIVNVDIIAIIKTTDNGQEDNKIICIDSAIKNIDKVIKKVNKFLHIYKGKNAPMLIDEKIGDATEAEHELNKAHKAYLNKTKSINNLKIN